MTHLSEERDIAAAPEAIWRILSDTMRWPQFYATPKETLHLRSIEYLEGTTKDGPHAKRRLHFLGVPSWDEECSAWRENEFIAWLGNRNPGLQYWQQQIELIPGTTRNSDGTTSAYTTVRWDVYFTMGGPRQFKSWFKRTMESIVLSSLERLEPLAREDIKARERAAAPS